MGSHIGAIRVRWESLSILANQRAAACAELMAVVLSVEMLFLFLLLIGALVALVFQGHDLPWESPWTEILNSPERDLYSVPTPLDLTSGAFG